MNQKFFVKPKLGFYQTFDDAFNPKADYFDFEEKNEDWKFDIFFKYPRSLVLAEPGFGKTVLLKQISENSKRFNKKSIYVDCKKIFEQTIESHILKQLNSENGNKIENNEDFVICFDALDEVRFDAFSRIIEKIKLFMDKFNKIMIIISCRRHYFFKHKTIFSDYNFRIIRIFPFSNEQIHEYLIKSSFSQNNIEKLFNLLSIKSNNFIIQTPRYLSLLTLYIRENSNKEIESITRADLFEYFIYSKLKIEAEKLSIIEKEYYKDVIKRVLEKLALVMEIYQANTLKKEDLVTFFDDIRSNLALIMQDRISLNMLFEKSALNDLGDYIEFENTEFQEYLAAKEIIRLGKNKRIVFELAMEPELKEIRPSWFNTLQFLIDMDISLLGPILNFNKNKNENLTEDEEYHRLLTDINVNRLNVTDKEKIFNQVFNYYQNYGIWIDWDVARNLSHYFVTSHVSYIETHYKNALCQKDIEKKEVRLSNIAKIVGYVVAKNALEPSLQDTWKKRLIKLANSDSNKKVLPRISIYSLSNFKDDSVIEKIEKVWENNDKLIRDAFLTLCKEVNPNYPLSIDYFVRGTILKSINARYGIWAITDRNAVVKLLDEFIENEAFLFSFIDYESIFKDRDDQIIKNIKNVIDTEIEKRLHKLIITAFTSKFYYQAEHSKFLNKIVQFLKEIDKNYIFSLIEEMKKSGKFTYSVCAMIDLFALLLNLNQVKAFIESFADGKIKNISFSVLHRIKLSNRPYGERIYEEGRKFMPSIYDEIEKSILDSKKKYDRQKNVYQEFQSKLSPVPVDSIFDFYLKNKEYLDTEMTDKEKETIKNFVINTVLNKFDPGKQELIITKRHNGGMSYRTHRWITIYVDCLRVAKHLDIDLSGYRKKIINFIPFAFDNDLYFIFELIPNVTQEEIQSLNAVYRNKQDDRWRFLPRNLPKTALTYRIVEAVPILQSFVNEKEFDIYTREEALKAADALKPDSRFLKKIFKTNIRSKKNELKRLALVANSLLIEDHEDSKAIAWRINQLVKKAFPFKENWDEEVRSVSSEERELREKYFASPLLKLKKPEYESRFLNLLKESFEIYKKENYQRYAIYLWEIVCTYFDNRKEEASYKPLQKLESFVAKLSNEIELNWFRYNLKELKRSYLNYVGKPNSITDCIKVYNRLKSQQYLEISSVYDLKEKIKNILNTEIRRWIEGEGAYSFIVGSKIKDRARQEYEDFIQKTIKLQIENVLLKRGFKQYDIIREPQLLSNKRVDFKISYGFYGTVLIELKLTTNKDISARSKFESTKSFQNMKTYMSGYSKDAMGIFLVIDNKKRTEESTKWEIHFDRIKKAYEKIDNVEVIGLKCQH